MNRVLDRAVPGHSLHRLAQRGLGFTDLDVTVHRAGPGIDDMRIALLTDIHAGSFMSERDLCRIFESVAAREPDMVCLSGDLINTFEREILLLREPLSLLDPPLGIFAVPGNHDHFYGQDIGLWESFLREHGVTVLINAGERVQRNGDSLWVAGVDDLTEGQPDLPRALAGHRDDEPVLLLSHHPDLFFEAAAAGVELTLSGHTHGGQILLFGKTPLKHSAFGYWRGLFEQEGARLYVSRGVGLTFLPLRIGAPPEIPMLRVKAAKSAEKQTDRHCPEISSARSRSPVK